MHSYGIVHQDLRSANIGFRGNTPVLMDFSFASVARDSPLLTFRRPNGRKFPIRSMPSGYFGTRETASDRIMDLKARDENVDIPVTMHDDLCSLMKLWYLTCPGVKLPHTVKGWRQLKSFWWLFFPLEEMANLSLPDLTAKLESIFRTRSTDIWQEPENKRMKPDLLRVCSERCEILDPYDDADDGHEDRLLPETDFVPSTKDLVEAAAKNARNPTAIAMAKIKEEEYEKSIEEPAND